MSKRQFLIIYELSGVAFSKLAYGFSEMLTAVDAVLSNSAVPKDARTKTFLRVVKFFEETPGEKFDLDTPALSIKELDAATSPEK